jgi:hypothetical protein
MLSKITNINETCTIAKKNAFSRKMRKIVKKQGETNGMKKNTKIMIFS